MDTEKVVAILERFLDPTGRGPTVPPESALIGTVDRLQRTLEATRARLAAQDERLARLREDLARVKGGYAEVAVRFEDLANRAVVPVKPVLKPAPPRVRSISIPPPLPTIAPPSPRAPRPLDLVAAAVVPAPRERFILALAFAAATFAAVSLRENRPARAQMTARPRPLAAGQAAAMTAPRGDNAVAQALRLIFAYRPTSARTTVGEVLAPMLGKALEPSSWELTPIEGSAFWIVFRPYAADTGNSHQYRFRVDADARRVRPTPETLELLRADVAGRLASLSDFKGLRQALDLSGDDEVVVGQAADRMGR